MRVSRLVLFLAAASLAAFWSGAVTPLNAQAPITFDEYRNIIAQTLALVRQTQATDPAERVSRLNRAADALAAVHQVQTPSGALVEVNNAELVGLIRDPQQTEDVVARLSALEFALAKPLPLLVPAELGALRDLLNRPPFVQSTTTPWWVEILLRILNFFDRLVENTAQGVFDVRDLLVLVAGVVVIGVLVYFVRNLRRNLVSEETLARELTPQDARTPGEAFDHAQRYANAGDYRSAVRQLYLATLFLLDERGRIKYIPTLTNREYLRQTQNDPRAIAALLPIVETFDRTWYGFEPISARDFDEYRQRVERIKSL